MGTFDTYRDAPQQIITEGLSIDLQITKTSETTARISWNIPTPARGCGNQATRAYNGIVITIDTTPTSNSKTPTDGETYIGDPTADRTLHVGDSIDTSLVVGSFYNDITTTYVDITGMQPGVAYYASGFAVDNVHQYHTAGSHAYSLPLNKDTISQPFNGNVIWNLNDEVTGSTATGLSNDSTLYEFQVRLDGVPTKHLISFVGSSGQTINDLVSIINEKMLYINSPYTDTNPPRTDEYWFDTTNNKLYQWDGYQHVLIEDLIIDDDQPNTLSVGSYWYKPDTDTLSQYTGTSPAWDEIEVIKYHRPPNVLTEGGDFWFNGTTGYYWNGTVWCEQTTYVQTTDPSEPTIPDHGHIWYKSSTFEVNSWNKQTGVWETVNAIYSPVDPNTLSSPIYWFDSDDQLLYQWNTTVDIFVSVGSQLTVSDTEPSSPIPGTFWFDTTQNKLFVRGSSAYVEVDCIISTSDPSVRSKCQYWIDTTPGSPSQLTIYTWDDNVSAWVQQPNYTVSETDPTLSPTFTLDTVWWNTDDEILYKWSGGTFDVVTSIYSTVDPTNLSNGAVWFDTINDVWSKKQGGSWITFDPIDSIEQPDSLPVGQLWFDSNEPNASVALKIYTGSSWNTQLYYTQRRTPTNGTIWLNDSSPISLYYWNKTQWVDQTPPSFVEFAIDTVRQSHIGTEYFNVSQQPRLKFFSGTTGSTSFIELFDTAVTSGALPLITSLTTLISKQFDPQIGGDEISKTPSYLQVGVGTDGTTDDRKGLIDEIRHSLGYPVVQVELTPYQLDKAVTNAVEHLRAHSSIAYRRQMYFLDVKPHIHTYILNDKRAELDKIVTVMGAYRASAAFMSTAHVSDIFGQQALQHLYYAGKFDLLSFHITSEYIELMEKLLASRITFNWNERTRQLRIFQMFAHKERILLDCAIEKTEQELITDRRTKRWVEEFATAECYYMLADIRGKYSSVGNGVTLNGAEMTTKADAIMEKLEKQLQDYSVDNPEEWGSDGAGIIIG